MMRPDWNRNPSPARDRRHRELWEEIIRLAREKRERAIRCAPERRELEVRR
ncbi:MAG: hypothetical protein HY039_11785 [Nitrospirae bacterium]|nr:hypothetical protein [Nitrospirota bacterium]